jgi:hypothetical protein
MNTDKVFPPLIITAVCALLMWCFICTIKGNIAEQNWEAIQKGAISRRLWAQVPREIYIERQRSFAWFMVFFLPLVWGVLVWLGLKGSARSTPLDFQPGRSLSERAKLKP